MLSGTIFSNPWWLLILVVCALCSGALAQYCQRRFWPWLLAGIVFGPLTLIFELLFILPGRRRRGAVH